MTSKRRKGNDVFTDLKQAKAAMKDVKKVAASSGAGDGGKGGKLTFKADDWPQPMVIVGLDNVWTGPADAKFLMTKVFDALTSAGFEAGSTQKGKFVQGLVNAGVMMKYSNAGEDPVPSPTGSGKMGSATIVVVGKKEKTETKALDSFANLFGSLTEAATPAKAKLEKILDLLDTVEQEVSLTADANDAVQEAMAAVQKALKSLK